MLKWIKKKKSKAEISVTLLLDYEEHTIWTHEKHIDMKL